MISSSQVLKETLLYAISTFLMKGSSLLILPFVIGILSPADYGRLEILSSFAIIASIVASFGLEEALYRYSSHSSSPELNALNASRILFLSLIISFIILCFGFFLSPFLMFFFPGEHNLYDIRLVVAIISLESVISVPLGWLRMSNRILTYCLCCIARSLVQTLLVVILLSRSPAVSSVLHAGLLSTIIFSIILVLIQVRSTGLGFSLKFTVNALRYSFPIIISGVVGFLLMGSDRWFIASLSDLESVAIYGVAAKFGVAACLLLQPYCMWWYPKRLKIINFDNGREICAYYISLGIILALLCGTFVIFVSPFFIFNYLPAHYSFASFLVSGIVFCFVLKEIAELVNIGCFVGDSTQSHLKVNCVSATVAFILMPLFGVVHVWGVLFGLVVAYIVKLVLSYFESQKLLYISYPLGKIMFFSFANLLFIIMYLFVSDYIFGPLFGFFVLLLLVSLAVFLRLMPGFDFFCRYVSRAC